MPADQVEGPESSAVRVALWRALHVEIDALPHVLEDEVGRQLVEPDQNWRSRPDMDPVFTRTFRAAIVARARYIEELVAEQVDRGVRQYVILGAGLDTFVQRRPEIASRLQVFEVDEPAPQACKRRRLVEFGFGIPDSLHFVPVDFETRQWWDELADAGFDTDQPAMVASTGVSMYLTKEANAATLARIAAFAPGSTLAMTFLLPSEILEEDDRRGLQMAERGAKASGTPFISFFAPSEIVALAREAGFRDARHVPLSDLAERYFANRTDDLRPSTGEDFLLASA